jgi:hypothetical protein
MDGNLIRMASDISRAACLRSASGFPTGVRRSRSRRLRRTTICGLSGLSRWAIPRRSPLGPSRSIRRREAGYRSALPSGAVGSHFRWRSRRRSQASDVTESRRQESIDSGRATPDFTLGRVGKSCLGCRLPSDPAQMRRTSGCVRCGAAKEVRWRGRSSQPSADLLAAAMCPALWQLRR